MSKKNVCIAALRLNVSIVRRNLFRARRLSNTRHLNQSGVPGLVPKRWERAKGTRLAQVVQHMAIQPLSVPEQGAKRQGDLAVLIAFGAGRKSAGVTQDVAPVLNKFRSTIERVIRRRYASNRRHDATYVGFPSP
jgi:hypothetical protein